MKQRLIAGFLCLALLVSLAGCHRAKGNLPLAEDSAGTGFGALQKSALTEQDLYFLNYGLTRAQVVSTLGSAPESMLTREGVEVYRLDDGRTVEITYSEQERVQQVTFTQQDGEEQSLFDYLVEIGVLKTAGGTGIKPPADRPDQEPADQPTDQPTDQPVDRPNEPQQPITPSEGFFSTETYGYEVADQIIVEGAQRETVVSALGKPNRFSSANFAADGYLIDVYVMEDGAQLYLDYGYQRSQLRAVRKIDGSSVSDLIGTWGAEEKPNNFYRYTKNRTLFNLVSKGTTPAALFKRFGEPDWLEGEEGHYRAVYQLINGAVLYFDFGEGNRSLASAYIREQDGTLAVFGLR